jgi:cytidyltransferase-like protein
VSKEIICLSGAADPLHAGILRMIKAASTMGNVVFILNSDEWVKGKKGFLFMPATERREILLEMKSVHDVVISNDTDGSVRRALRNIAPDYFGHGDKEYRIPEKELCEELGIKLVWELGGAKVGSSTDLVDCMINSILDTVDKNLVW